MYTGCISGCIFNSFLYYYNALNSQSLPHIIITVSLLTKHKCINCVLFYTAQRLHKYTMITVIIILIFNIPCTDRSRSTVGCDGPQERAVSRTHNMSP